MQPSSQLSRETWISARPGTLFASLFHSQMEMRSSVGAAQSLDLVQEAMVERVARVLEGRREIIEMEHVAGLRRTARRRRRCGRGTSGHARASSDALAVRRAG